MNVAEAVKARRAIRGFKPEPVPESLLREILDLARFAASNCNSQPWHLAIVSGAAKDKLSQQLLSEIASGKPPSPYFLQGDKNLEGVYRERQYDCARRYYATVGITREDRQGRDRQALLNWTFFGAPHVGFLSMPRTMSVVNAVDLGIYLQTLMLLLVERGLASCPQAILALYPDPVFEIADIPEGNALVCGISFGYEDPEAVINQTYMDRAPLHETVTFRS